MIPNSNRSPLRAGMAALIFVAILGLSIVGGFLWIQAQPRQYYSRTVLEVPDFPYTGPNFQAQPVSPEEAIRSREVLSPVLERLKLAETWGTHAQPSLSREEAFARLAGQIRVQRLPRSHLVEIGAFSIERQEAANIANEVALSYRTVLMNQQERIRASMRTDTDRNPTKAKLLDVVTRTAQIMEKAEPSIYPALPDVLKSMITVLGIGLLAGTLGALGFLALTRRPHPLG